MPRPLILKVNDYKPQANKKVIGSINVQLLKENVKTAYGTYNNRNVNNASDQYDSTDISQCGTSIVRSLINRYESTTARTNLTRFKSKSLADLEKPTAVTAIESSQDDFLYNKNIYHANSENKEFDFKRVFSVFENPTHLNRKRRTNHLKNNTVENLNLTDIKQRAKLLLENSHYESNYSLWQNQVIELLQQIRNLDGSVKQTNNPDLKVENTEEHVSVFRRAEELPAKIQDSTEDFDSDKPVKVKDIKSIFEEKSDDYKRSLSRTTSSYSAAFGMTTEEDSVNNEHRQLQHSLSIQQLKYFNGSFYDGDIKDQEIIEKYSALEELSSDVPDEVDNFNTTDADCILQQEHSGKVNELKNFFESEDKHIPFENPLKNGQDKIEEEDTAEEDVLTTEENVHTVDHRLLPPPKICIANEEYGNKDIKISLERIKGLIELLKVYEGQINSITNENNEDANYINEQLIRILIELDELTTYGDKHVLMERRNAIQCVQDCIQKLKDKVNV